MDNLLGKVDLSLLLQEHNVKIIKDTERDVYDIISIFLEKNVNEEAFYIVDIGKVISQYNKWIHHFPNISPYYAIKCNPNNVIIQLLASLGCNFDCASKNEIATVLDITKDPGRIIFANPCKMSNQIKYARAKDVDLMTFDSVDELKKIQLFHPYSKLILRIKVNDKKSKCQFGCKFGADLKEAEKLLHFAKISELNIVGVSFHVGSGCGDVEQYRDAIELSKQVFDMGRQQGFDMHILDIGGGFPGTDDVGITFEQIANTVNKAIDDFFKDYANEHANNSFSPLEIIAEPGRFLVESSHLLVINVIGKKMKVNTETGKKEFIYYMNDGIYGSFNCIYFDHAKPKIAPFNERDEQLFRSKVFGPTCDSMDLISEECMLPDLAIGEWCFIENFGAYTTAASSSFNGFIVPDTFYIITYDSNKLVKEL